MATIRRYDVKGGRGYKWEVRYRTPDRSTTRRRGFSSRRDAQNFLDKLNAEMRAGEYVRPIDGRVTVGELGKEWLKKKQVSAAPSHYRPLESAWRLHVKPRWGNTPVSAITTGAVEDWITDLQTGEKKTSATHILRLVGVLQGVLDDAVIKKCLPRNPARGVTNLPKKHGKRHIYLEATDVRRIANATGNSTHETIVYVLAYAGLRWSELVALQVGDVDFEKRRLTISKNAPERNLRETTKSGKIRSVPIPQFLADMLQEQCAGRGNEALVFPGRNGSFLTRPKTETGWFEKAVIAAGVQRITPHDLRHTCASLAVHAGANVLALQRMLGHASAAMTLDCYSDLLDSDLDSVAEALNTVHSRTNVSKTCPKNTTEEK